jgi:hypothetical protein
MNCKCYVKLSFPFLSQNGIKLITDAQVFYNKFSNDKVYLFVCIGTLPIFSTTSTLVQNLAC